MHSLIKNFNHNFVTNVHFNVDIKKKVKQILNRNRWKNLCIIIDRNLTNVTAINQFIISLKSYNLYIITCDVSEPTYKHLEEKRISKDKIKIDVFIGIGGGSSIDFTKGLAVLYTNNKAAIKYRGFNKFKNPIKPIIAIPTTSGTGSEITPNASFINNTDKRKMGINGEAIRPKYALMDPKLTLSCPKFSTISAAVDSLVHSTEAFVAKKTNFIAKKFAKEGFKLVIENLNKVLKHPNNIKHRENVMLGAFLSAVALMNSGTGPAAAMSYPTGVHYKVPHGIGGGIFLPYIIKYNINNGFYGYGELYQKNKILNISPKEKSLNFLNEIKKNWIIFSVPKNLKKLKINYQKINLLTKDTCELKGALQQNPVKFDKKEIFNLFSELSGVKLK